MSQVSATALGTMTCILHSLIHACLILIECDLLSAKELQAQYRSNDHIMIQVEAHTARRAKDSLNNQSDEKYEARYEYQGSGMKMGLVTGRNQNILLYKNQNEPTEIKYR